MICLCSWHSYRKWLAWFVFATNGRIYVIILGAEHGGELGQDCIEIVNPELYHVSMSITILSVQYQTISF